MEIPYETKIVRTNGVALNVVQAGPASGKPVILLHGFPEFWYSWRHQIPHLVENGFRVWAPDQRGYNESDKPNEISDYRMDELVWDVVGLINAAGHDKAYVVGHDWGAIVAWWLALRQPQLIEKLAILNAPHPRVLQRQYRSNIKQLLKSWYAGFFQLPILPESLMTLNEGRVFARALRQTGRRDAFNDADMATYREAWAQPGAARAMLNWYRAYRRYRPEAPGNWRITMPTLIIWGMKDNAFSTDVIEPSYDLCDKAQLVTLKNATHWVQHEERDRVNTLLTDFLSE